MEPLFVSSATDTVHEISMNLGTYVQLRPTPKGPVGGMNMVVRLRYPVRTACHFYVTFQASTQLCVTVQ